MATWKYERDTKVDMGFYAGYVPTKIRFEYSTTADSGCFFIKYGDEKQEKKIGSFSDSELKEMFDMLKEFDEGYGL